MTDPQAFIDKWEATGGADVGYCFDLYADFIQTGKEYKPLPDPQNYRVMLDDLAEETVRNTFKSIWAAPLDLDPSRIYEP